MKQLHRLPSVIRFAAVLSSMIGAGASGAGEPLQAEVRVLSQNVFGKAQQFCADRYRGFGHIAAAATPAYDIIGLTEFYGTTDGDLFTCDSDYLLDAIRCTARYTAVENSQLFYPRVGGGAVDGGQGVFTTGSICDLRVHAWTYQKDWPNPRQGVILARIQLPNTTVTIDTYVVHLHAPIADDCNLCCRWLQLLELREFIAQHSARSGNPVLVMGDFNIAGPPSCCSTQGYEYINSLLGNPIDFWLLYHGCGQSNCGNASFPCNQAQVSQCDRHECDGFPVPDVIACQVDSDVCGAVVCANQPPQPDCPANAPHWGGWAGYTSDRCLNELADAYERIDYVFAVNDPALSSSAWTLEPAGAMVADFTVLARWPLIHCYPCNYPFCDDCTIVPPGQPFIAHVSDHLGVEATLRIRGEPAVWVDRSATGTQLGTSCAPFATVTAGTIFAPQGHRVLIRSGVYAESPMISRRLRLEAVAGSVRIGA